MANSAVSSEVNTAEVVIGDHQDGNRDCHHSAQFSSMEEEDHASYRDTTESCAW